MTHAPNVKQLAAIVHEVVAGQPFGTWAELVETVKTRCAQLRVPYDSGSVTHAIALVARTRPVLTALRPRAAVARRSDVRPLSRAEAGGLWARIMDAWRQRLEAS